MKQSRDRPQVRRDRRLRRHRAVHRPAGEELLVGHVRPARLLGRHQRRPRHPAGRRGAGRRRRQLPGEVHGEVRRLPARRQDRRHRQPRDGLDAHVVRRRCLARPRQAGRSWRRRTTIVDTYIDEGHARAQSSWPTGAARWGSGEVQLTKVELLDARRADPTNALADERHGHRPAALSRAEAPSTSRCSVWRSRHLTVCTRGPTTAEMAGYVPDRIEGIGSIDLVDSASVAASRHLRHQRARSSTTHAPTSTTSCGNCTPLRRRSRHTARVRRHRGRSAARGAISVNDSTRSDKADVEQTDDGILPEQRTR